MGAADWKSRLPVAGASATAYACRRVFVLNREGLEAAACECYRVVRDEFERLLG